MIMTNYNFINYCFYNILTLLYGMFCSCWVIRHFIVHI